MMEQPEALRLAESLDGIAYSIPGDWTTGDPVNDASRAAAELRRQHAEIERLRADAALVRAHALEEAAAVCDSVYPMAQGDYAVGYEDARNAIEYKINALKASPDAEVK